MSELSELCEEIQRLGVPAHVHDGPEHSGLCGPAEICIREPLTFVARLRAPDGQAEVEVDTMTALGSLADLPADVGFDALWAELVAIDNKE